MARGNGKLVQECFSKHLHMEIARMKKYKETEEKGKKRGVNMEGCTYQLFRHCDSHKVETVTLSKYVAKH